MTNLEKFRIAPIGEREIKWNLFSPNGRTRYKNEDKTVIIYEDDEYLVEQKGNRLTQLHRDILDVALFYGDSSLEEKIKETRAIRLFSLYEIQKRINYKIKNNHKFIEKKLSEIQQTIFKITTKKNGNWTQFSLIDTAKFSKKQDKYAIVLNDEYLTFFNNEISINYKELLDDIWNLENPQTKSIVRYLLTFNKGHQINIDKLLKTIGVNKVSKRVFNRIKKEIIEELKRTGKKFNIELIKSTDDNRKTNDYTVKYTRHPKVKIYYPPTS